MFLSEANGDINPIVMIENEQLFRYRSLQEDDSDSDDEVDLWFVGVVLYAFGAFFMALGVVLQKYSINREFKKHFDLSQHSPKYKQPYWVAGIVLYGSSGGFMSAALGFAAQSLLSPLMSIVIISNAILSRFLLQEPLTVRDFRCIVVIVIAVIATTLSAPSSEDKPDSDELVELYKELPFVFFIVGVVCLLMFFRYHYWKGKQEIARAEAESDDLDKSSTTPDKSEFMYSFSFGGAAGCWGGLSVTMMKSAITILTDKFEDEGLGGAFSTPLLYGLLAVLVLCWYMQLSWINAGLERYPSVFVVSIEAVLNEVVAVSGGIFYFQEYKAFEILNAFGFASGMILGIGGILFFAMRDNTVGADQDLFTNSEYTNCCKCCNLPLLTVSEESTRKMLKRKSLMSSGRTVLLNENGKRVGATANDLIVNDTIQSPVSLAAAGLKVGARRAYKSIDRSGQTGAKLNELRMSIQRFGSPFAQKVGEMSPTSSPRIIRPDAGKKAAQKKIPANESHGTEMTLAAAGGPVGLASQSSGAFPVLSSARSIPPPANVGASSRQNQTDLSLRPLPRLESAEDLDQDDAPPAPAKIPHNPNDDEESAGDTNSDTFMVSL